ncbi:MAG TPA: branched-chain amino acid ABC transporter permease [Thermodesulfobacteriota bacterium]|nr:branched-chain amino acid ABC transporter permease [Thermodesulfobacteriota bacterium]
MYIYAQAIVNGILIGSIYGLIAFGLTLIFGIMRVINFAHASLLMLAMFIAFFLSRAGIDPYLSMIIEIPSFFLLGYLIQRGLIERVLKMEPGVREPLSALLLTAGLLVLIENLVLLFTGPDYKTAQTVYSGATFKLGSVIVKTPWFYGFLTSIGAYILLTFFFKWARLGQAIRAVGQDRDVARLMGIDHYHIYGVSFGIGMALLGISGAVLIPFYYVHPAVGWVFGVSSFIIVILGGLGSISGAFWGGVIIGLIESLGAQFMNATWTIVVVYAVFLAILFIRPSGLLGQKFEW